MHKKYKVVGGECNHDRYAPFDARSENERLRKILTGSLVFPAGFNLHARDLVSKLCVVNLSKRFGMLAGGLDDILQHPFFAGIDWYDLRNELVPPPCFPKVCSLSLFFFFFNSSFLPASPIRL